MENEQEDQKNKTKKNKSKSDKSLLMPGKPYLVMNNLTGKNGDDVDDNDPVNRHALRAQQVIAL